MKTIINLSVITILVSIISMQFISCKPNEMITAKTGAQIWGENCIRCHNAADPATFSDVEWDVAMMHMQIRANLTPDEAKKVADFLQSSNNN
jgi:mono/diheme cytochrome c family protein